MSTVFGERGIAHSAIGARTSVAGATTVPIKWFAVLGASWLAFQLYVWGSWILSPDFALVQAPPGDEERRFWIKSFELCSIGIAIWCLYHYTFKPLIRDRRLTTDGLIIGVMPWLCFQDPFGLYAAPWWNYSAHFTSFGNWMNQVPGAIAPNAHFIPEPIFAVSTFYVYLLGIPLLVILAAMRAWKRRYPTSSPMTIFMVGIGAGFIYDVIIEGLGCQVGIWAFTGAIREYSIFGGSWNQYPLYEMVFWGGMSGLLANVMYWTNDKGQTFAERGVEKVKTSPAGKGLLRYLAILGVFQSILFVTYSMPIQFFAMNGDGVPENTPAHLRTGCGEGSAYACIEPGMPINRVGQRLDGQPGMVVSPDMTLIESPRKH
ncbi:MAG: spirocyclase AveC family protein [Sinimarinibacterium sp.]